MLLLLAFPVAAQPSPLASQSFDEVRRGVEALAVSGDPAATPILGALQAGRLLARADGALFIRDPGGAATGRLLPTGRAIDTLEVPGLGALEASLVDAANPLVFVEAAALGLEATEKPDALAADPARLTQFEAIRVAAALAMGLVRDPEEAKRRVKNVPIVALIRRVLDERPAPTPTRMPAAPVRMRWRAAW